MHAIALWLTFQCISFQGRCANLIQSRSWLAAVVSGSSSYLLLIRPIRPVCWHISSWILGSLVCLCRHLSLTCIPVQDYNPLTINVSLPSPCNFVYRFLFSFALWHKNFAYFVASVAACGMFIWDTDNCECVSVSLCGGGGLTSAVIS